MYEYMISYPDHVHTWENRHWSIRPTFYISGNVDLVMPKLKYNYSQGMLKDLQP